jgi:hypothetical protein
MVRIDSASSRPPPLVYVPAIVMAPRPIRETSSPPREMCLINVSLSFYESDVVMIEMAGQLAVRLGQFEEQFGPVLEGGDRVGAGRETPRRLHLTCEVDQSVGELGGIAPCRPFILIQAVTVCSVRSA